MRDFEIKFYVDGEEVSEEEYIQFKNEVQFAREYEAEWVGGNEEETNDEEYIDELLEEYLDDILNIEGCPVCGIKEILDDLFWEAFAIGYNAAEDDYGIDEE